VLALVEILNKPIPQILTLSTADVKTAGLAVLLVDLVAGTDSTKATRVDSEYCVVSSVVAEAKVAAVIVSTTEIFPLNGATYQVPVCDPPATPTLSKWLHPSVVSRFLVTTLPNPSGA
jgi:hypothetical protein